MILDLGKWLPWQQSLQPAVLLQHTDDSRMLVELMQYAVNKRYQMQPTQTAGEFCTILRSGKEGIQTVAVCLGHMFTHTSPPSVCSFGGERGGGGGSYLLLITHCFNHFSC